MKEKRCTGKCKQVKPIDDFSNKKANRDGKNNHCRDCVREARPSRSGQPKQSIIPPERVKANCMDGWWL